MGAIIFCSPNILLGSRIAKWVLSVAKSYSKKQEDNE
jgi:hypothetical protein